MIQKFVWMLVVVLAIVATACGGHKAPRVTPTMQLQADLQPPAPQIPECWDPQVVGQFGEWFSNEGSNTPTYFQIKNLESGQIVCHGVVQPGARKFGPAIWSTAQHWAVTGLSLVTVINSTRTQGYLEEREVRLEYRRTYGWYTRCPC